LLAGEDHQHDVDRHCIDASLLTAHSDKEGAAGTYKGGFGFHPLMAYLDCPDSPAGGMPLAALLRPGDAGANTAADHTRVLADALEQLPRELCESAEILMRADSAGATHELLDFLPRRQHQILRRL